MTLTVLSERRIVGYIGLAGGKLTGSTRWLQRMADQAAASAGSAAGGYEKLRGQNNGYLLIAGPPAGAAAPEPPTGGVAQPAPDLEMGRFDAKLHPRDGKGRWARKPGAATAAKVKALSPVYNEVPESPGHGTLRVHAPVPSSGRGREDDAAVAAWRKGHPVAPPITEAEARDGARPVSYDEFQSLAREGLNQLGTMAAGRRPMSAFEDPARWGQVKSSAYGEVRKSWGGATIDPRTGEPLPQGADAYALTVKPHGLKQVQIPEGASAAEFSAAMDEAKARFARELEKGQHYLGVFHDDENHRIDIDPVIVVGTMHEVETIGSYSHAIGGAYHFATGDGAWPPYVDPKL